LAHKRLITTLYTPNKKHTDFYFYIQSLNRMCVVGVSDTQTRIQSKVLASNKSLMLKIGRLIPQTNKKNIELSSF